MKTQILILTTLFLSHTLTGTELAWVDEQVEAIKPPRKASKISNISSPFVFLEKNGYIKIKPKVEAGVTKSSSASTTSLDICDPKTTESRSGLNLDTIINSSAMINGKWYKKSDKVQSYKILSIDKTSVTLKKGDKKMTLSTNSKKRNLKFKNK